MTCPKSRVLLCLLCMSTRGLGTRGCRAMGMEQGCSGSLPHSAALPHDVTLIGFHALGTACPALALQDVPGSRPPHRPCAPRQRAGGACQEGLGLCLEKGLIRSQRHRVAHHGSSPGATALAIQTKPSRSAEPLVHRQPPKSAFQFPNVATLNLTPNFGAFRWHLTERAGGSCPGPDSG